MAALQMQNDTTWGAIQKVPPSLSKHKVSTFVFSPTQQTVVLLAGGWWITP